MVSETQGRSAAAAMCILLCTSCAWVQSEGTPSPIRVRLDAATRLNPDERGQSLPTVVRILQLTSTSKAETAELTDLLHDPKAALEGELAGVSEVVVQPGGKVEHVVPREKGVRAVAVVAVVRRPGGRSWRQILPASSWFLETKLDLFLEDYRIHRK